MPSPDDPKAMILAAAAALFAPGQVAELRVLGVGGRSKATASGWFSDFTKLAEVAANTDHHRKPEGIYITLNPVNPACIARSPNKLKDWCQTTTSDRDIVKRHWLPIDIDPVRPSGVSSTDAELDAARNVARATAAWLEGELHFPPAVRAASGNGIHLLYRIDLPNDDDSRKLVSDCLAALDGRMSTPEVKVDRSNINAARIFKCYGTMARKGEPIEGRPHRRSRLLTLNGVLPTWETTRVVPRELLDQLAALAPEDDAQQAAKPATRRKPTPRPRTEPSEPGKYAVDLDAFISEHAISVSRIEDFDGTGKRYILDHCLFDPSHTGTSAGLGRSKAGRIYYRCFHDSCSAKTWQDVKALFPKQQTEKAAKSAVVATPAKPPRAKNQKAADDDNPWDLARQMIDEEFCDADTGQVIVRRHRECWYQYDEKARRYKPLTDDGIRVHVTRWLGEVVDKVTVRRVFDVINALAAIVSAPCELDPPFLSRIDPESGCSTGDPEPRHWLTLRNGILDVDAIVDGRPVYEALLPHTTEWFSTCSLSFPFPINAEAAACPRWQSFLDQIFSQDAERIAVLQEAFGSCFFVGSEFESFVVLHGKGRNGKSTVLNVLRLLLGAENVCSLSVEQLTDKYLIAQLAGKLANICADMNELDRMQEGMLKAIVSGDSITADRKYKASVQFRPTAKLFFATNVLPRFADTSLGIWRRMVLIPFDFVVPEADKDVYLPKALEKELPGIFYWALQGLLRLRENRKFTDSETCRQANREYRMTCFPVLMFLEECTTAEGMCTANSLWSSYRKWCSSCGLNKPKPLHQFIKDVLGFMPNKLQWSRPSGGMEGHMEIYGLSVKPIAEVQPEFPQSTLYGGVA